MLIVPPSRAPWISGSVTPVFASNHGATWWTMFPLCTWMRELGDCDLARTADRQRGAGKTKKRGKPGVWCKIGHRTETHLSLKSHKTCLPKTYWSVVTSFQFLQSTAVQLPCFLQRFKLIWQLKRMLWIKDFSRDLNLRWVPDRCHICSGHIAPGTHFTNDFSITIQIRRKFHLDLIQLLMIRSQQNLAHATTAQLSCHVPNLVAITSSVFGWEQNEISITFQLWSINC